MLSKDQIQVGFSEVHGGKPGDVDAPLFYPLRGQSIWPGRLAPWTAARSSCSKKVRPGEWGGPAPSSPPVPSPAHLSLPATEKLVEAKLEDVKHRLCSQFGARGCSAITEGLFLRSQEAAAAV